MVIYVDIDETICKTPKNRDYSKSKPLKNNIKKINDLFERGHTIVYWTARGSSSGKDHSRITKQQLYNWNVKYDELKMGKPMYDLFICDKAINSIDFFAAQL